MKKRIEAEPDSTPWCLWRWFDIPGPDGKGLYLRRLTVVRTPWFQVLLHWIYLPDPDRGLHNHPWRFVTFPLRGFYAEQVGVPGPSGWKTRYLSWVYRFGWKGLRHAHRIVWLSPGGAVTLVLTGGKRCAECEPGVFTMRGGVLYLLDTIKGKGFPRGKTVRIEFFDGR